MRVFILEGIGNGDWMPIIWLLAGIGVILLITDTGTRYIKKRKLKNRIHHEAKHAEDDTSFFSDN